MTSEGTFQPNFCMILYISPSNLCPDCVLSPGCYTGQRHTSLKEIPTGLSDSSLNSFEAKLHGRPWAACSPPLTVTLPCNTRLPCIPMTTKDALNKCCVHLAARTKNGREPLEGRLEAFSAPPWADVPVAVSLASKERSRAQPPRGSWAPARLLLSTPGAASGQEET